MATIYDDYIWRLTSASPVFSIDLPKDLEWSDESQWSPVEQLTEYSLTGALLIQEGVKLKGRTISLMGKDDMAWIDRADYDKLISMRNTQGIVMSIQFLKKLWSEPLGNYVYSDQRFSFNVRFNHGEGALDLQSIKRWDGFEPEQWFIVRSIKLMEVAL